MKENIWGMSIFSNGIRGVCGLAGRSFADYVRSHKVIPVVMEGYSPEIIKDEETKNLSYVLILVKKFGRGKPSAKFKEIREKRLKKVGLALDRVTFA